MARRFTVTYENRGSQLQISLFDKADDEPVKPPIQTEKRGVGKQVYEGPGTFQIAISGQGLWRVKVYDGT